MALHFFFQRGTVRTEEHNYANMSSERLWGSHGFREARTGAAVGRTESQGLHVLTAIPCLLRGHPSPSPEDKAAIESHLPLASGTLLSQPSEDDMTSGIRKAWVQIPTV